MYRLTCGFLVVAASMAFAGLPATAPAAAARPGESIFGETRVWTAHLHLSAKAWQMMQPAKQPRWKMGLVAATQPSAPTAADVIGEGQRLTPSPWGFAYAYARGELEMDGQKVSDVAVRFKGNYSYSASAGQPRRPMKMDFARFSGGRLFGGEPVVNFHVSVMDGSQLREAMAYGLFRDAGLPAPRTAFALVYLTVDGLYNREYLGLYTLVEEVNVEFLKRNFGDAGGILFKPEGVRGLPYLGKNWARYFERYNPEGEGTAAMRQGFVDFIRLVHFADDATFGQRIGTMVDFDSLAKYVAVNAMIANTDSFLCTGHNYYMYLDARDGRLRWIPWDMNLSFGTFWLTGNAAQQADLSLRRPHVTPNRLIERLLAHPPFVAIYEAHLRQLAEGCFSPGSLDGRMERLKGVVRRADEAAKAAGRVGSPATQPALGNDPQVPPLERFVRERAGSIAAQVAGQRPGYVAGDMRKDQLIASQMVPQRRQSLSESARPAVMMADGNKDGKLTGEELSAALGRWFAAADGGKGWVDEAGLREALAEAVGTPSVHIHEPGSGPVWATIVMKLGDGDKDGRLTLAEAQAALKRIFAASDGNHDGALTEAEVGGGLGDMTTVEP